VFFEVYDNGLVVLKAREREVARKTLNPSVTNSQIDRAFGTEIEELRKQQVVPSPYGFKAYIKPSLGKMVLRKPYNYRRQRKKKQNHERSA
jgi:hypothetical protein